MSEAETGPPETPFDQTTDALRWAEAFQQTYRDLVHRGYTNPWEKPIDDEGWLLGWFANAIERGRAAGAAPFGGEGQAMCGHAVTRALLEGRRIQIRFLTDGDASWEDCNRATDQHPEGIPPEWYAETFGQIDVIVRDVTGAPEFEGVTKSTSKHPLIANATIRNHANDGP